MISWISLKSRPWRISTKIPNTICLAKPSTYQQTCMHEVIREILCMGVCVELPGITTCVGETFLAHVFLGHLCRCEWRDLREGEEWLACLSLWGLEQNTTLMKQCVARRKKVWCTGTISNMKPSSLGIMKKGRHPVTKVNILISSFRNSSSMMKLFLMVIFNGNHREGNIISDLWYNTKELNFF